MGELSGMSTVCIETNLFARQQRITDFHHFVQQCLVPGILDGASNHYTLNHGEVQKWIPSSTPRLPTLSNTTMGGHCARRPHRN